MQTEHNKEIKRYINFSQLTKTITVVQPTLHHSHLSHLLFNQQTHW